MNEYTERLPRHLVTTGEDDARAFEMLVAESSTLAVRVAHSVLRNRSDAEDVAQEAFLRAHRSFHRLRDRQKFRSWLVRLTWRLSLDWKRGHRRRSTREDMVARSTILVGSAEADLVASERAARLWAAIDELPEKLRMVIVLAAIQEHSLKEVAELISIPEGTVKSRLFEARQQLQERLR